MADSGSGPKRDGFLDKGLSWDKRLELARAERARIEAEQGPLQITPKLKPWEAEAEDEGDGDDSPAPVQGYPGLPRERRAAVARRMRAAESGAEESVAAGESAPEAQASGVAEGVTAGKTARSAATTRESRAVAEQNPAAPTSPQRASSEDQPEESAALESVQPVRAITRPLVLPGATFPELPETGDAALAVNRLLTAPPTERKSALYGARFDPIPAREPNRRGFLWLVALVCVLGGLLVGVLVAVGLFFALANDTRKPSPQRLLAWVSGNPADSVPVEELSTSGAASFAESKDQEAEGPEIPEISRAEWTSASVAGPRVAAALGSAVAPVPQIGEMPVNPVPSTMRNAPERPQAGAAPKRVEVGEAIGGPFAHDLLSVTIGSVPVQVVPVIAGLAMPSLSVPPAVPGPETRPTHFTPQARLTDISPDRFAGPQLSIALEALTSGPRLAGLAASESGWRGAAFDAPLERSGVIGVAAPDAEFAVSVDEIAAPAGTPSVVALVKPMAPTRVPRWETIQMAALNPAPEPLAPDHLGPVAPDRALACATCQLTASVAENRTVRLRLPQASNVRDRRAVGALLENAGFDRILPGIQALPVSASQVRYFRPEDAEAARLLAELVRADLFDLSWFSPLPPDGTIEVLIASGGLPGTMPPG